MSSQKSAAQRRFRRWWHLLCNLFLKKLFLEDDSFSMQIEVPLTTMPLRVDFLLEQTRKTVEFANPFTANFRRYNMIEFKSPEDYLSMEDFYRGIAYVRLYHLKYHSDNYHVLGEVTMTFSIKHPTDLVLQQLIHYSLEYGIVPKREWEEVIHMLTGKRLEKREMELLEVTRKSWLGEMIKEDAFMEGKLVGKKEGKLQGKLEGQIEVVQKALQSGVDITLVAQITPFSVEEILQIQKKF